MLITLQPSAKRSTYPVTSVRVNTTLNSVELALEGFGIALMSREDAEDVALAILKAVEQLPRKDKADASVL